MNIVVCVKQVPDTASERTLRSGDGTIDRATPDGLINELDEYAIEEGLQIAEAHGGEVTILTMGPERALQSVRKALSMGADKAVHLVDEALAGSDALATSYALANVLGAVGFDLVVCGAESTDARTGVLPAMLAERLGLPQLTLAGKVDIDGTMVTIRRVSDDGYDTVTASLPDRGERCGEDQRAQVPVVQGHHGGQKEASADLVAGRCGHQPGPGGPEEFRDIGDRFRDPPSARCGRDCEGRGRRRRQGGGVHGRAQVHLRGQGNG